MSSDIEETIRVIRDKINANRNLFSVGVGAENNVVQNVIYPVLRSLGWTGGNNMILGELEVKIKKKKGRADLVLSKGESQYILAIEVKNLGERVDAMSQISQEYIEQLIEYLISLKREFGILTNGAQWHLIRRDGYDWETIWIKNLLTDDLTDLAQTFSSISPENSENLSKQIQTEKKKNETIEREWSRILEDRDFQVRIFANVLIEKLSDYEDLYFEPSEITDFLNGRFIGLAQPSVFPIGGPTDGPIPTVPPIKGATGPPPGSQISLKNEIFVVDSSYRDIVRNTGEWLASKELIDQTTLIRQKELFHRKPILVKASDLTAAKKQMKVAGGGIKELKNMRGWYLDSNHSPNNCVRRAQDLLQMCGLERSLLKLNHILSKDLENKT